MTNLSNISTADLERELELRKTVDSIELVPFDQNQYEHFLVEMQSILKDILVSEDGDGMHYAYEAAMKLAFGDTVFTKLNKIR